MHPLKLLGRGRHTVNLAGTVKAAVKAKGKGKGESKSMG